MFEKVNPSHPDKVADRIAGAIVDLAYTVQDDPKVAVVVLIGHGVCHTVIETSAPIEEVDIADAIYEVWPYGGKYIKDGEKLIICQSNAKSQHLREIYPTAEINPLGDWTGGTDVDTGATNRKLGSDMADSVTGGGLHGKDLSKADVSVNIYAWLKA